MASRGSDGGASCRACSGADGLSSGVGPNRTPATFDASRDYAQLVLGSDGRYGIDRGERADHGLQGLRTAESNEVAEVSRENLNTDRDVRRAQLPEVSSPAIPRRDATVVGANAASVSSAELALAMSASSGIDGTVKVGARTTSTSSKSLAHARWSRKRSPNSLDHVVASRSG